ncbi:MAG: ATP-binding protein [Thiotrichales bacterium]|nr:ATP-binding protein [Thiotrichales bacterium]
MNTEILSKESIFRIGKVISVDGRKVKVAVNSDKNLSHIQYKGELVKNISVGSYIKILKGFSSLVGKVDGEFVNEENSFSIKEYANDRDKIKRILIVNLLGYFEGEFKRGIKELPLIDNECFILEADEFNRVHDFIRDEDIPLKIGELSLESGVDISLGANSLFASHIGIFGNTGSGKSYTLAKIYAALFSEFENKPNFHQNAKFYLFDFNGEYITKDENDIGVIVDRAHSSSYDLTTRTDSSKKFPIKQDAIDDINFWSIYLGATEKTQTPFLKRALKNDFYFNLFNDEQSFKKALIYLINLLVENKVEKSDVLSFLREVVHSSQDNLASLSILINDYQSNLYWHSTNEVFYYTGVTPTTYSNAAGFYDAVIASKVNSLSFSIAAISYIEKIRLRIVFQYFDEMARYDLNTEHISPLLKRLKRIEDLDKVIEVSEEKQEKTFNVISLKNVNTEMKKVLPLLVSKQLYESHKSLNDKTKYLNIIIDEAHNILSYNSERESVTWKDYRLETFEEIIKEGRKFGVFLTVASQRPSDISPTIISQLHNYFLHRLINNNDIYAVEKTISYLDKVSFESLPIIPTGSCIFAGLAAQVPVMIDIGKIKDGFEPRSTTIKLTDHWI